MLETVALHRTLSARMDRYLMFYDQSTVKGHIRAKQHAFLPQVKFWFTTSNTFHRWRPGLFIYLFIEGLWPSQPHRVTSGLFTSSNLTHWIQYKTCTLYSKVKHINIIYKVSPFGIALIKKWLIKLGAAGTIDWPFWSGVRENEVEWAWKAGLFVCFIA